MAEPSKGSRLMTEGIKSKVLTKYQTTKHPIAYHLSWVGERGFRTLAKLICKLNKNGIGK